MRTRRSRFMLVRAGALCAVAGLLTMAACEAKIPTSAELTSMDLAAAEKAAASSGAFSEGSFANADYFLNGEKMSREELRTLKGEQIGSLTVVKGKAAGGRDTIFVVTKDKLPVLDSVSAMGMKVRRAGTVTMSSSGQKFRTLRDPAAKQPAIMIDGKLSTESALAALREDDIVSVQVLKPTNQFAAGAGYPDGLLAVETKIGASSRSKVRSPRSSAAPEVVPAYQIDGVPSTRAQFEALDSRDIVTVDVHKDKATATALSNDPAAVNGLVRVSTKRAKPQ